MSETRQSHISRNTKETQIQLAFELDTPRAAIIETPLPFFNHMLNTLATHGQFGLTVQAAGDIDVDPHHLIEDVGIVLGMALRKSLGGNFGGIHRAGCFRFPMDETLSDVAIDLCSRPNLVWHVPPFESATVGAIDPRLFREFFKGWVDGSLATVHINVPYRDNDHHVVEATFKAFARGLNQATRPLEGIMSTKGVI